MVAPVQRQVLTPDGVVVALHDLGGNGPVVVMAHATGFHGRVFLPMAREMVPSYHCIALDERGHGDSDPPPGGDFDWNGFATDVLAVVDWLGDDAPKPLGVGHSAGGAALLLAEQRRPGTFSALYLWEPVMMPHSPRDRDPDNFLSKGARRRREEFGSADEAYENFASKPPFSALDPEALRAYVDFGFEPVPGGGVRLKCRRDYEALVYEYGSAHDAFSHLGEVACPVTIACGEKTDAFGPVVIRAFAEMMPAARAVVLDGLGHFGPLEDPLRVASSVMESFAGVPT